jgi:hypothetical protein
MLAWYSFPLICMANSFSRNVKYQACLCIGISLKPTYWSTLCHMICEGKINK